MHFTGIFRNAFHNRTRSVLTIAGIAVGVFSVVLISAIGGTGASAVSSSLCDMGINTVMIQSESAELSLCSDEVSALVSLDGAENAMPLMASSTEIVLRGKASDCLAWGVSESADEIISLNAEYGRLVARSDIAANAKVCVIDEKIAVETYGRANIIGKKIDVFLGGAYYEFEIIGVASSGINVLQNMLSGIIPNFVYIPYTTMQNMTGRSAFDRIAVLAEENSDGSGLISRINEYFDRRGGSVSVTNLLSQKKQLESIVGTITLILSLIAGISLFVSGINVMTVMLVSVNERKREIGIKKSIGARNRQILAEFLAESLIISAAGALIGAFLGLSAASIGSMALGVEANFDFFSICAVIVVCMSFGLIFGAYPAKKAAEMKPVDALNS